MPRTFLYFVPDRNTLTPKEAAQIGLAYAFESGIDCCATDHGPPSEPGGPAQRGIVCAQQDSYSDGQLGYHADRQVWRPIPGSNVHVGHYKGELPAPEDLERKKVIDGRPLELDDTRWWMCPLARAYSEKMAGDEVEIFYYVHLPQRLDLGADGRWTAAGVNARYAALWELSEAWQSVRDGQAGDEQRARFDYQGQIDAAVLCLQANYRLGRAEVALLGLFNDTLTAKILDTLIDAETFFALVKKKLSRTESIPSTCPASSSSSAGPEASTATTDPPGPTSPPSPAGLPTATPSTSTS